MEVPAAAWIFPSLCVFQLFEGGRPGGVVTPRLRSAFGSCSGLPLCLSRNEPRRAKRSDVLTLRNRASKRDDRQA